MGGLISVILERETANHVAELMAQDLNSESVINQDLEGTNRKRISALLREIGLPISKGIC